MCKIIVVANQKGGVAKTSTVRNLSYSLAELGKRVLTVDFDAQFNLTTCFGIENPNELKHTIAILEAGLRLHHRRYLSFSRHTHYQCKEISAQVDAAYRSGMKIFDSQIPMTVKVGEANCCGMAVAEYDKKCPAGQAYMDFAREVIKSA